MSTPQTPPTPAVLPDKMPEVWVEQVASVVKSEIASGVKSEKTKIWFPLLMGSSVIAAVVSYSSSCYNTNKTISATKDVVTTNITATKELAGVTARLDAQKALVLVRQRAYIDIKQTLDDLVLKLQSFITTVQIAQHFPVNTTTRKQFDEELKDAGKAHKKVIDTIGQRSEVNGLAVVGDVGDLMGELSLALSAAQTNPEASLSHIESDKERIRQLSLRVQEQISKEIENIH